MTTLTIDENFRKKKFSTALELFNYINDNFDIEISELENQSSIISSWEYEEYNDVISKAVKW